MERSYLEELEKSAVLRLLALNMLLVLIGYSSAYLFGRGIVGSIRVFKTVLVFTSLIFVISKNGFSTDRLLNVSSMYLVIIGILVISLFSGGSSRSLYRGLTFMFPFLYILFSINFLLRYGALNLLVTLSLIYMLVYSIVPISYIIFGADLGSSMIYGETEGEAFVSNHYGWGSCLYILSAYTVYKYYPLKPIQKYLVLLFIPFSFYLVVISASRSGILSLGLAFLFFLLKDKHINNLNKILIIIIPTVILIFLSKQEYSAIDFMLEKNEKQIESGEEGRLMGAEIMINKFNAEPTLWFTGVGMFNYKYLDEENWVLSTYHNSYLEILFGAGFIVLLFFLFFMVLWPIIVYWNSISNYSLLIFPLFIIPFFEGDLTAGQFLFFPWFTFMILLNAKELHPNLSKFLQT